MAERLAPTHTPAGAERLAPTQTLAVDFDGVLHQYLSPWQGPEVIPDPPVDGAIAWLMHLAEAFRVVILTTRGETPGGQAAVRAWLDAHGYEGPALAVTNVKPPAIAYVDDRAWRFEGRFPSPDELRAAMPWRTPPA
jgi:hypothetical protein